MNQRSGFSKHSVRSSATLTGSYVAGTVFSAKDANYMALLVQYTKGDETQLDLKIEVSNDDGTTYGQQSSESVASGTSTVSQLARKFTATGNYLIDLEPFRGELVKVSVKATGGTPTGTAAVDAYTSWV